MKTRAGPKPEANTDSLIKIGLEADLFHSPDGTGFADLQVNGHRETWPIRSKGFRRWLGKRYFELTRSALNVIEARAQFEGPTRSVHVRVAGTGDRIYLDLADEAWRCVEISSDGRRIVGEPPVRFRRSAGMLLPSPMPGGSVVTDSKIEDSRDPDWRSKSAGLSPCDHPSSTVWMIQDPASLRDRMRHARSSRGRAPIVHLVPQNLIALGRRLCHHQPICCAWRPCSCRACFPTTCSKRRMHGCAKPDVIIPMARTSGIFEAIGGTRKV